MLLAMALNHNPVEELQIEERPCIASGTTTKKAVEYKKEGNKMRERVHE